MSTRAFEAVWPARNSQSATSTGALRAARSARSFEGSERIREQGTNGSRWVHAGDAPSRAEIHPAALDLVARHGSQILGTARRYSANLDDAEDAYQRALEILLTKAPTTSEDELVPWLKTVVKHEAFAIRKQRERFTPTGADDFAEPPAHEPGTPERSEHYERLRCGAEAMRDLKPAEVRCLLLRAEGFTYDQICEVTGFTYTKVNRSLTEGRRAFLARVEGIESGAACERVAPLLSSLADGEASAADLAALRPHLRSCLACRARLREYRAAPARVAALIPPAALVASGAAAPDGGGPLARAAEAVFGAVQDRAAVLADRLTPGAELATGQKVVAVGATAAALAGGGAATVKELGADERARAEQPPAKVRHAGEAVKQAPFRSVPAPTPGNADRERRRPSSVRFPAGVQKVTPAADGQTGGGGSAVGRAASESPPSAADEFSPEAPTGSSPPPSSATPPPAPPPTGGGDEFGP